MSLTKLPPEVLLMVGAYCAYEDLHSLVQVNQYLSNCFQSNLDAHKELVERYNLVNVLDRGKVPFDADRSYYTNPLFILNEVKANPFMLDYAKHLRIGRMDGDTLCEYPPREHYGELNEAWQTFDSTADYWLQSTASSVVRYDTAGILRRCRDDRGRYTRHPQSSPPSKEYHQLLAMLLLVLPKLTHLEICGMQRPLLDTKYRMYFSPTGPIATTLHKCLEVQRLNQDGALAEHLSLPAFQNLTHLTVRSLPWDPDVLQSLTHLAILPSVRRLDCYGFVERGAVALDWSAQQARGVEPPSE